MKNVIKRFTQFVNENHKSEVIEIDLVDRRPDIYGREARLGDNEDDEEYTEDIQTTIRAVQVNSADEDAIINQMKEYGLAGPGEEDTTIHDSYHSKPVRVKITYTDDEGGYGTYGPSGGGSGDIEVFAGVDEFTEEEILQLADTLYEDGYLVS